jgi:hypothetical protein
LLYSSLASSLFGSTTAALLADPHADATCLYGPNANYQSLVAQKKVDLTAIDNTPAAAALHSRFRRIGDSSRWQGFRHVAASHADTAISHPIINIKTIRPTKVTALIGLFCRFERSGAAL